MHDTLTRTLQAGMENKILRIKFLFPHCVRSVNFQEPRTVPLPVLWSHTEAYNITSLINILRFWPSYTWLKYMSWQEEEVFKNRSTLLPPRSTRVGQRCDTYHHIQQILQWHQQPGVTYSTNDTSRAADVIMEHLWVPCQDCYLSHKAKCLILELDPTRARLVCGIYARLLQSYVE